MFFLRRKQEMAARKSVAAGVHNDVDGNSNRDTYTARWFTRLGDTRILNADMPTLSTSKLLSYMIVFWIPSHLSNRISIGMYLKWLSASASLMRDQHFPFATIHHQVDCAMSPFSS